ESISQLRLLPAERIQAAVYLPIVASGPGPEPPKIRFGPVVDGRWLPLDPARAGTMRLKVPLLTGFNADEELEASVQDTRKLRETAKERYGAHAEPILALYPHDTDEQSAASAHILARDRHMAALLSWTQKRAADVSEHIWAYRFDHALPVAHP